jgi:negative regulator of flagellin synthesis FlgM
MKIDINSQPVKVKRPEARPGADNAAQTPRADDTQTLAAGDKVVLSDRSKLIAKARELAASAPDVRAEKVADLTARIAAGTYHVSSEKVAASIIKKSFTGLV